MITGEQVREAMIAAGITVVNHHECSICGVPVCYFRVDDRLYFDSSCDCASSTPRQSSWEEAADWINMQSKPEHRAILMRLFGLREEV